MEHSTSKPLYLIDQLQIHMAHTPRKSRFNDLLKRWLDVLVASIALVVFAPVAAVIAISIRRDSPGPVIYRGPRLGKGGKLFNILKFRTMYETSSSYEGPRVTAQDDPRVTPLGRWLRDTKLNELPQFWNVLVGEMSLVGPRPEDPQIGNDWPEEVRAEVLAVRPGITSPASVLYRHEETLLNNGQVMDTYLGDILPSKLRLDQLYVRNRSFLLDLDVLFWTFLVLLPKVGMHLPPEERLFLGPLSRLIRRYISWFIVDILATFTAISLTGILWRSLAPLNVGWGKAIAIAIGFSLLYSLVGAVMGVNRIDWNSAEFADALDLLPAVGLATVIALSMNYIWTAQALLPPGLILMSAVLAYAGFVMVRYRTRLISGLVSRWLSLRGGAVSAQERVLIVGGGESGQFIAWWLQNGASRGIFRTVGYVDDDLYKQDTRIRGVNVLGRREDIPALVKQYDVGIILFAIHNIPAAEKQRLLKICSSTSARLFSVPDIMANLREVASGLEKPASTISLTEVQLQKFGRNGQLKPEEVDGWLAELEHLARAGASQALEDRIRSLRGQLDSELERDV